MPRQPKKQHSTPVATASPAAASRATPAHRPSRRDEIIDAAISVFAQHGFVDASIAQVAESAGVAVTAVYYHFASKQDLYDAALARVLRTVDEIVEAVRTEDTPADRGALHRTIDAVWDWVDDNPGPATLMALHTPAATPRSAELRHEFDELHIRRAFAYVEIGTSAARTEAVAEAGLAVRALVDLLISIHPMRLPGGPLSGHKNNELRNAVKKVSTRLLTIPR